MHSRWTVSTQGQEAHQQQKKHREGRKRRKLIFFFKTKDKLKVEERIKCVEMKEIIAGSGQCGEQKRYEKNEKLKIRT